MFVDKLRLFVRNQDGVRYADGGARQAARRLCRGECAHQQAVRGGEEAARGAGEEPQESEGDPGSRQQAEQGAGSQERQAAVRQDRLCHVRPVCVLHDGLDVATQVS